MIIPKLEIKGEKLPVSLILQDHTSQISNFSKCFPPQSHLLHPLFPLYFINFHPEFCLMPLKCFSKSPTLLPNWSLLSLSVKLYQSQRSTSTESTWVYRETGEEIQGQQLEQLRRKGASRVAMGEHYRDAITNNLLFIIL